jgi:hypothetical protein
MGEQAFGAWYIRGVAQVELAHAAIGNRRIGYFTETRGINAVNARADAMVIWGERLITDEYCCVTDVIGGQRRAREWLALQERSKKDYRKCRFRHLTTPQLQAITITIGREPNGVH